MGLKDDILKAFETNLTHDKVNQEGEIKTIKPPTGRGTPLDTLATELRDAFIDFLVKQDFNITNMEAPFMIKPGQINTVGSPAAQANAAPVPGFVQISETSNKVGLPTVNSNVRTSKVKLLRVKGGTA